VVSIDRPSFNVESLIIIFILNGDWLFKLQKTSFSDTSKNVLFINKHGALAARSW
jgi:hypothetical protein